MASPLRSIFEWKNMEMNASSFRALSASVICFGVMLTMGCGATDDKKETRAVVTGRVTFKGEPVPGGMIFFHVTNDQGPQVGTGRIESDGTYKTGLVPIGMAKIAVENETSKPGKSAATTSSPIPYTPLPRKYARPDTSGLTFDVKAGIQTCDIDLK